MDLGSPAVRNKECSRYPGPFPGKENYAKRAFFGRPRFTTSKTTVTNALSSVVYDGGQTPLYNAIYTASSDLGARAAPRYAVVMTDGKNNVTGGSTKTDAINQANLYNVDVYTVGFGPGIDTLVLSEIATQTGGVYYNGADSRALDLIAGQIAATLTCR